jgi:hypothetical protein
MRWLVYGNVTDAVAAALRRHGQQPVNADEAQLPPAVDPLQVLDTARRRQLEILTADAAIAEAPFAAEMPFNRLIVHLNVGGGDIEQDEAIDRLFARYPRVSPGRLYTVTASRVKVRQLPTSRKSALRRRIEQ